MKALLLAAGLGTRLAPITDVIPKCLAPINGIPLLFYWLDLLSNIEDIDSIIINTHYMPQLVGQLIEESPYADKVTIVAENELLGTAGTVKAVADKLQHEPAMVIHSDNFSVFNPQDFYRAYTERPEPSQILLMSFATDQPKTCGILEIDNMGLIHEFHEKVENPPGHLANAAVYIIGENALADIYKSDQHISDISTQILPNYLGRMSHWENEGYHRDIGNYESLVLAQLESPKLDDMPFVSSLWQNFWLDEESKNLNKLAEKIARALNFSLVKIEDEIARQHNYIITVNKWDPGLLSDSRFFSEDRDFFSKKSLLIIGEASRGTTSKMIREEYGIKSLILSITAE